MQVFSTRLKEARIAAKLSQEKLGVMSGIEEASASARMNQYERGKHQPEFSTVERLAKVLDVPEAYLYAKNDDIAELLILLHRADKAKRDAIMKMARETL